MHFPSIVMKRRSSNSLVLTALESKVSCSSKYEKWPTCEDLLSLCGPPVFYRETKNKSSISFEKSIVYSFGYLIVSRS